MPTNLSTTDKAIIMAETAAQLADMIQKRLSNRIEALNALSASPMENLPDEVKKMREIEGGKIRAVMQEQKDLIDIIKVLFPNVG
jgi:predicted amidohydrolase